MLVDSEGNNLDLITCVGEVLARPEAGQAFEKAPHTPAAGASTAAVFNEKLQAAPLFLDDAIALRVANVFPKYSFLIPVRAKNPQEVWDAFCSPWIGVFGHPMGFQMDEGGEWKIEVWLELRPARRIKLPFQRFGARRWVPGRRNSLVRCFHNRLKGDDRFPGKQILAEVQWRLNTIISGSRSFPQRTVFGSNPSDHFGWEAKADDLTFAQNASFSG